MESHAIGRSRCRVIRAKRWSLTWMSCASQPGDAIAASAVMADDLGRDFDHRSCSPPALLVDERHEVALARMLGRDLLQEVLEAFRLAGLPCEGSDAREQVDRGPIPAVVLGVDLFSHGSLIHGDGVARVGGFASTGEGHPGAIVTAMG